MKKQRLPLFFMIGLFLWQGFFFLHQSPLTQAQTPPPLLEMTQFAPFLIANGNGGSENGDNGETFEDFDVVTEESEAIEGLFNLYHNTTDNTVYLEIQPNQLNQDYLWLTTLSSGLGNGFLLSGLPITDFLFRFQRVQDQIQMILPNLHFRTNAGDPLERSLERSFSDSIIASTPIISIHPEKESLLIDLSSLLLSGTNLGDLLQILPFMLGGSYTIDPENSSFGTVNSFPHNVEVDTNNRFIGESLYNVSVLPDSRSFNLNIHYSLSEVPHNNYRPRLADDRVGYFITAYKNLSDYHSSESFVRYIERWNLEPSEPTAELSPPKEPIVFWIDNATPEEYREAVAKGVLTWNRAFEKIGFQDAIQVKQMPDDADWDPADSRYNVIRWTSSFQSGILGVGPSHVNPLTGQILDADVIINADSIRYAKHEYENFFQLSSATNTPQGNWCNQFYEKMWGMSLPPQNGEPLTHDVEKRTQPLSPFLTHLVAEQDFCYGLGSVSQFHRGTLALSLLHRVTPTSAEMKAYIEQYLINLVSHEVGHTLGLRHNFHGSTLRQPEELHDLELTRSQGLIGSVMDYAPVNLAPPEVEQGDYYPITIGPYDEWAIEYGYKPSGERFAVKEKRFLEKIAQRAPEPELAYATDEDAWGFDDPEVNVYDLSGDLLTYAEGQIENANRMWKQLETYVPRRGETYNDVRVKFNEVLFYYFQQIWLSEKFIGGRSFNRDHPGDPNGRLPFETVSLVKQRQALNNLDRYLFADDAFNFSSSLLNRLAPSRWLHWGQYPGFWGLDYPVYDLISWLQQDSLWWLLSNYRLSQIKDAETKTPPGEALTLDELFSTLENSVWKEILFPNPEKVNLSTLRRSLQREHLEILSNMVLRKTRVPEDARTLAWYQLRELYGKINGFLSRYGNQLDLSSKAHLEESRDRIVKSLSARLQSS